MANIQSFPNNQNIEIGAENVMKWHHGRTSGVFAADNNAAVAALVTPAMAVSVSDGIGWMSNSAADGVVWWNDAEAKGAKLQLDIEAADGVLNRIDRIIVEWKTTNYVDLPEIKVLKGTTSSTAVAPSLTNNSTKRQISLAQVSIPAGTTAITANMITDERLNPAVCGIVTETLTVDTSTMQAQFAALLSSIQNELSQLEAGTAVELKKLQFSNVSVPASLFVADTTYEDYGYKAAVSLSGVTSAMIPEVVFALADAVSGIFAPICETFTGGVYLYSSDVPEADLIIPTIICWKGN